MCRKRSSIPTRGTNCKLDPAHEKRFKAMENPHPPCFYTSSLTSPPVSRRVCHSTQWINILPRSLSGIRNHNLDLIVRAALSSAKSEAGTPALPHLFASERPQGPFSQPRHGFSLLIA